MGRTDVLQALPVRRQGLRIMGAGCILGGLLLFSNAGYLQAKAWLAQYLIADAWTETLQGARHVRPWRWADTWPVARLTTPSGRRLYVLNSLSGQSLAFGPGFMPASQMAGLPGTMVIAGHKDSHFAFLEYLNIGDVLLVQTSEGKKHRYRVKAARVADSRHDGIRLDRKEDELMLTTCYPFGSGTYNSPYRYVVEAVRV